MLKGLYKIYIFMLAGAFALPALADYGEDTTFNTAGGLVGLQGAASRTLALLAGSAVGTLLAFLGILFLVMIIAGGFMWMTAAGAPAKTKTARGLIISAIIGLIIVLSAYAIVTFIGDNIPK